VTIRSWASAANMGTLFMIRGYDAPTKNDSSFVQALALQNLAQSNCVAS
jgi:hypothetical protein